MDKTLNRRRGQSQHNTRPVRPKPRPRSQCARPRQRPRPIFWSQTGLVLRPTVSDHITVRDHREWGPQIFTGGQGIFFTVPTTLNLHCNPRACVTAKNSLVDVSLYQSINQFDAQQCVVRSSADVYANMAAGGKVQLSSQLRSEIHRCKRRRQRQRNTTENARNQHATSVFEQRQMHRETSYRRKSTVDGQKTRNITQR